MRAKFLLDAIYLSEPDTSKVQQVKAVYSLTVGYFCCVVRFLLVDSEGFARSERVRMCVLVRQLRPGDMQHGGM